MYDVFRLDLVPYMFAGEAAHIPDVLDFSLVFHCAHSDGVRTDLRSDVKLNL